MNSLSNLTPKMHRRAKKRVGRGSGSGKGSYSGRGIKGQRSRSGGKHKGGHAGKKMPLFVSQLPKKRGFQSNNRSFAVVNLEDLSSASQKGIVTPATLRRAHKISDRTVRVKVLGTGTISEKLEVRAHAFSASAKDAIIKAGGSVHVLGFKPSTSS